MSTSEYKNDQSRQPDREHQPRQSEAGAPRPRRRRRKRRSIFLTIPLRIFQLLGSLILIGLVTGCFVACYGAYFVQTEIIPEAGLDLSQYSLRESSVICYEDPETGETVEWRTLSGTEDRIWVDYEQIPEYFLKAAVAIEDKDFWTHQGVDWWRTAGAVYYMMTGADVQGGSTITQQLIKNLTEEDDVTVKRKVGEIFNALEFERAYEKEDIITWYLNEIYLGSGKYGIVTASKYYFGKDLSEITLAEAASIIAITNNPSIYSPASTAVIKTSKGIPWTGVQWNKYRQELILEQMEKQGKISKEEYDEAVKQKLNFVFDDEEIVNENAEIFSWYEEAVIDEVVHYLMDEHGLSERLSYDIVYGGGLVIHTALDPNVQNAVDVVYSNVENLPYISNDGQQMQSSITVVDNSTGYVVAMAGAIGEKTGNLQRNNATSAPRQPGSSLKPLAAYSPAIEMGLVLPNSIIDDFPLNMNPDTEKPWPRNDNKRYDGLTTVKEGITESLNTIATRLVAEKVGVDASFQFLTERYGLTTLVERQEVNGQIKTDLAVAPLSMGGLTRGVTTYEMTAAFATFPRAGAYTEPTTVLRVETKEGDLVWDNEPEKEYVIKESTAFYMNDLLYNAANFGTGGSALFAGQNIAGKTGTTSDNYDRWFAGYTPYYTGVVWTGYPYNMPITGTNGVNPAAALWREVMTIVHEDLEKKDFFQPGETETVSVCLDCGEVATEKCANDIRTVIGEVSGTKRSRIGTFTFLRNDAPKHFCTCHDEQISICTECPVLDEAGKPTGAYHLAGRYCPEASVVDVNITKYSRTPLKALEPEEGGEEKEPGTVYVPVTDAPYLTTYYDRMRGFNIALCNKHNTVTPGDGTAEGGNGEQGDTGNSGGNVSSGGDADRWAGFDWDSLDPYDPTTWPFNSASNPDTWPFDPYDRSTWPIDGNGNGGTDAPVTETPSPDDAYLPARN